MGHSHRRNTQPQPVNPQQGVPPIDFGALSRMMGNIDVSAMANMLNGIDLNQVMSLLSNPAPAQNQESEQKIEKTENSENIAQNLFASIAQPQSPVAPELSPEDPTYIVLNSLKPFLPQDKCTLIDDMIKLLGIKSVIDSIFPTKSR